MTYRGEPTRADDSRDLAMMAAVKAGHPQQKVAARFGVSRSLIAALLARVIADDLRYSGEPKADVLRGYRA